MAAILPFLEQKQENAETLSAFGDFGEVAGPPSAESCVAEQTRMLWTRQELERLLLEREFQITTVPDGTFVFQLNRDIPKDAIPWSGSVGKTGHGATMPYSFFTANSKMGCAGWDLPSGSPHIAGTCPGAIAGQHIVPAGDRERFAKMTGLKVNVQLAICAACYAGGYPYSTPYAQAGEMIRYWWARECSKSPEGRHEFTETMAKAVLAFLPRKVDRFGHKYVRVHSSGDFFSPAYYQMWLEVADRVGFSDPTVRFWAPSRVWMLKGYDWSLLADLKHDNLVVRPSSYHMNDPAPEKLDPSNAQGSTALYNRDNLGMRPQLEKMAFEEAQDGYRLNRAAHNTREFDTRYDWACQTYAINKLGKDLSTSCSNAKGPDGKIGCRACWLSKNLRVCYTAH